MSSPRLIHHLKTTIGEQTIIVRGRLMGVVTRGIGIWPATATFRLCEEERFALPADMSGLTFSIVMGTDVKSVEVFDWRIVDIQEATHGRTSGNGQIRPLEWDLTLEDGRWRLMGNRGGLLMQGVLNPTLPDGSIVPGLKKTNSELIEMCLSAMPLTWREGVLGAAVIAKMDAIEPPAEIIWRGAHAPTELQRLLEWTRCAFCYNQGGTYSIHILIDPPDVPDSPYITEVGKLPSQVHTIAPADHEGKCIIASCPTRHLIQRVRTLYQSSPYEPPRPLQWVGVEDDGAIRPLEDLSWWPGGKTPIDVFKNKYQDVDADHQRLAAACVFRMVRLHDDDLAEGWTFVERLVDQDFASSLPTGEPLGTLVLSNATFQGATGVWINPSGAVPVDESRVDLGRGVVYFSRPQVRLTDPHSAAPEQDAVALTGAQLSITFGHHPNAADHTDYFMGVYEWDPVTNEVVKVADPDPPDPPAIVTALAEGVPVYRFPDLQLMFIEQAHPSTAVDVQNDTEIEALALGYAKAMITAQQAKFEVQEYPGLHNVDPNHSTTMVVWDPNSLMTTVHLGRHQMLSADYITRVFESRSSHGGRPGAPAGGAMGTARGVVASAAIGSVGPTSGQRDNARLAVSNAPAALPLSGRRFWAKITGATSAGGNKWTYDFTEVVKTSTGFGASAWAAPANAITGTARNLFELINTSTGANYLGIGITVDELLDTGGDPECPVDLRPVPEDVVVQMHVVDVFPAAASATYEYWFQWANGVYEASA